MISARWCRSIAIGWLMVSTGCTWVQPTPQSDSVRIVTFEKANGCQKLGRIGTSVKASVGVIQRSAEKVASELDVLARNEAAEMGADTIVREGAVNNGARAFAAYRCF